MDFAHAIGVSIFHSFMMDIIHLTLVVIELKVEAILWFVTQSPHWKTFQR